MTETRYRYEAREDGVANSVSALTPLTGDHDYSGACR